MENLEFTISQYLDGTLLPEDRLALELRLKGDSAAEAMLDEYRRLDAALKSMPLPAVQWEFLAQSISSAVDAAHEERASRTYRMPAWIRMSMMPLALAASLLIVAGVGIEIYNSHQSPAGWTNPQIGNRIAPTSSTFVAFQTDKASGPIEEDIAIGPGAAAKIEPIVVSYSEDAATSPSHVTVVSGVKPAHDIEAASYFDMQ